MVWVDLANSPQVMFFAPFIRSLQERGVEVLITVRDFSETVTLATKKGLRFHLIGGYGGRGRLGKAFNLVKRAYLLASFVEGRGVKLALSHNSYEAILAARILNLQTWTYMDYDGQPANHLAFRLAHRIYVQEWFPEDALRRFGASPERVFRYRGLKEEVYLRDFKPDPSYPSSLGVRRRPFVVARPPSTSSLYSRGYGEFWEILAEMRGKGYDVRVVARNPEDGEYAHRYGLHLLPKPVDGPQLLYWCDAFVGGGGTMTREAVILGTRTFTVFPAAGFLDAKLMEMGLLERLDREKVRSLRLDVKRERSVRHFNPHLLDDLIGDVMDWLNGQT